MKKDKHTRKVIILIGLIALSIASIVLSLNHYITLPWELSRQIEEPIEVDSNETNTFVITGDSREIVAIDKNNNVTNAVTIDLKDNKLGYISSIKTANDGLFASILENYDDTFLMKSETIVKTDNSGKYLSSPLTINYDFEENKSLEVHILSIFEKDSKYYAIVKSNSNNSVTLIELNDEEKIFNSNDIKGDYKIKENDSIVISWFDQSRNQLFAMNQYGKVYGWDIDKPGQGLETDDFISDEFYKNLYKLSIAMTIPEGDGHKDFSFNDETYDYIKNIPSAIEEIRGNNLYNSPIQQIRIWMFWLGVSFLSIMIIIGVTNYIRGLFKNGNTETLKTIGVIVGISILSLTIVSFYSIEFVKETVNNQTAVQRTLTQFVKDGTSDLVNKASNEFKENGYVSTDTYNEINDIYKNAIYASAKEGNSIGYLLSLESNDRFYSILTGTKTIQSGSVSVELLNDEEYYSNDIYTFKSVSAFGGYTMSRLSYTDDNGQVIGHIYTYSDIDVLNNEYLKTCLSLFLKLFVGALSIIYIIVEVIEWYKGSRKRKKLEAKGISFSGSSLTRPMGFLVFAASSADSALVVIIVKEMLANTPYAKEYVLFSLPAIIMSIGFLSGLVISYSLFSRFRAKLVLLISVLISIVSLLLTSYFVYTNNVLLMLISLLFFYTTNEICLYYVFGYAIAAPSDELRRECNHSISASKISGYALITIIAGYASTLIGNYAVYLTGLIPVVILLIIILTHKFEDRNVIKEDDKNNKTKDFKERIKFLLSPRILALIVGGIGALQVLRGYKSYVFPLFADVGGLSKSSISNIQVFAQAIVFIAMPIISKFEKKVGETNVLIITNITMVLVFLMFFINSSVSWAVITLFVVYIATKSMDPCVNFIWQQYAKDSKTNMELAQSTIKNTEQIIDIVKTPVLGFLLGFGQVISCMILAIYLALSTALLKVFGKKE